MHIAMTPANPIERFLGRPWGFDDVFDQVFPGAPASTSVAGFFPSFAVEESDDALTIRAEVPGVAPEDLTVAVDGDVLTISGKRESARDETSTIQRSERAFGSFSRSFRLPSAYDTQSISANHENGILVVRVAKSEAARPRTIAIESN